METEDGMKERGTLFPFKESKERVCGENGRGLVLVSARVFRGKKKERDIYYMMQNTLQDPR